VADPLAVARLFAAVAADLGPVDVLVNCAGHGGSSTPTAETADDDWARMLAVHLSGTFYCMRAALRVMQPRRRGRSINFASVAGLALLLAGPDGGYLVGQTLSPNGGLWM